MRTESEGRAISAYAREKLNVCDVNEKKRTEDCANICIIICVKHIRVVS